MHRNALLSLSLLALAVSGCASSESYPDAGPPDVDAHPTDAPTVDASGGEDAGPSDAGGGDAAPVDGGTSDAGLSDSGAADAGPADGGVGDGGLGDGGLGDGGLGDGGLSDAGAADAGLADGGGSDAGLSDGGPTDAGADASAGDAAPSPYPLLITEILDGTLAGGVPKFVELTNVGSLPIDLADYSLGIYANGSTDLYSGESTVLSGSLSAGDSFVVSFESGDAIGSSTFLTVFGFDADNLSFPTLINGNDAVRLFRADGMGPAGAATGDGSDATIVDSYGEPGVDGSAQIWDYSDSYASRISTSALPSPLFQPAQWSFAGPDALDGATAADIALATSPGSHVVAP